MAVPATQERVEHGETGCATTASASLKFAGQSIHCVGIGGCGLSGLARLLGQRGAVCTGTDIAPSELTEALRAEGIPVGYEQSASSLPERCDLVIASAAITPDHPELQAAKKRGICIITYAEALGMVQGQFTGISIAGTHGKSTTAAMLCHALIQCGLDPSFIIGAICPQIGGGSRVGSPTIPGDPGDPHRRAGDPRPGILVAEACEFNRSFHRHHPLMALINNVEEDHLDVYGSLDAIIDAFRGFAQLVPQAERGGRLLIGHDGAERRAITAGLPCRVQTFGFNPAADFHVEFDPAARCVTLLESGQRIAEWINIMPGETSALNSAAAAILASYLGADWKALARALCSFQGIERRMQRLGTRTIADGQVIVYDDYGHHPTEIDATLRALRAAQRPRRLICVFQPHQHSRTRFLLDQFARSFCSADVVIVPHIYFVRDSQVEKHKVSAADLVDRLRRRGTTAMHLYPFDAIVEQLEVLCRDGDLVVTMGAGPVWQVARSFLERKESPVSIPHPHLSETTPAP